MRYDIGEGNMDFPIDSDEKKDNLDNKLEMDLSNEWYREEPSLQDWYEEEEENNKKDNNRIININNNKNKQNIDMKTSDEEEDDPIAEEDEAEMDFFDRVRRNRKSKIKKKKYTRQKKIAEEKIK